MPVVDVTERLEEGGVDYELLVHRRTDTAASEAAALDLPLDDVGKTLIAATPGGYLRVLLPASDRLDLHKLRSALGVGKGSLRLATEVELAQDYPEFELGAVPPLGGGRIDPVLIDAKLASRELITFEAGTHGTSVRMRTAALQALTEARIADVRRDEGR